MTRSHHKKRVLPLISQGPLKNRSALDDVFPFSTQCFRTIFSCVSPRSREMSRPEEAQHHHYDSQDSHTVKEKTSLDHRRDRVAKEVSG